MTKKNNTIRLTEQELNILIEHAVRTIVTEGRFKNTLSRFGKKLGNAALATAMSTVPAATTIGILDQGAKNVEKARQELGMDDKTLRNYDDFLHHNDLEDNGDSQAMFYAKQASQNESKIDNRIARIIREEISKVI